MHPIDFEGSNITMNKPENMTDEECMPLKAMKGIDENGYSFFDEVWQPNKEDKEAISNGRPIRIRIMSNGLPPIAIWTTDEHGQPNI